MAHHLKMLCVDDNEQLRSSLEQQFLNEDFEVETADDGDVALEKIKKKDYDIVLLDVMMKNMHGTQVLKELQKINKRPHIIMLTAVDDVEVAIDCVKMGARDFIQKPYDPEELLHIVIKVLGSQH